MSDYFGALMRSSGMAIGGGAPTVAQPRIIEPSLSQIDIERESPAMAPRTEQTASSPQQQAVAPIPVVGPAGQPTPPGGVTVAHDVTAVQTGWAEAPQVHPDATADAADTEAKAVIPFEKSKPALGQTLVYAAMQWVAADPQSDRNVAPVVPPSGCSSPAVTESSSEIGTTQTIRVADDGLKAQATPARSMTPEPFEAQVLPVRFALATPAVPVTPFARDEVVEISIGAIHVRVDAPATQAVAWPLTTPDAAATRATSTAMPPRSALSRRALRRI